MINLLILPRRPALEHSCAPCLDKRTPRNRLLANLNISPYITFNQGEVTMQRVTLVAVALLCFTASAFAASSTSSTVAVDAAAMPAPPGCGSNLETALFGAEPQASSLVSETVDSLFPAAGATADSGASRADWCAECGETGDCFPCCRCEGGGPGICTKRCFGW